MSERTMYLVRGLPGSGKTTLSKELIRDNGGHRLSSDDYFTIDGDYYFDAAKLGAAHTWNKWRAEQIIKAGCNLAIDNTNTTWKECKPYVVMALAADYDIVVREPLTGWRDNISKLFEYGTHDVPKDTLKKMLLRWESTIDICKKIRELKDE
tara:strand:+ start:232 stop:687 length:456 start_codon:yes stop_codon:yes gene_type:complete